MALIGTFVLVWPGKTRVLVEGGTPKVVQRGDLPEVSPQEGLKVGNLLNRFMTTFKSGTMFMKSPSSMRHISEKIPSFNFGIENVKNASIVALRL